MWHVLGEEERVREVSAVSERVWDCGPHHRCHHHQHHRLHNHYPLHQHCVGGNGEVIKCYKSLLSSKWDYQLILIHLKYTSHFSPSYIRTSPSQSLTSAIESNMRWKFQVALSNLIPGVEISFTRTLSATTEATESQVNLNSRESHKCKCKQSNEQKLEVTKSFTHTTFSATTVASSTSTLPKQQIVEGWPVDALLSLDNLLVI